MADYNGLSRSMELENALVELIDLWDQGLIVPCEDTDLDEIRLIDQTIIRAKMALDGELEIEVELEGQ